MASGILAGVTRLVILGGPGDGLVVAETVRHAMAAGWPIRLEGFLNDVLRRGEQIQGIPVLGRFEDWPELDDDLMFVPAVQKVRDMPRRVRRIESLGIPGHRWASVRHPQSVVAEDVEIGVGSFIASFVTVQPRARIGPYASLRAGAMVGHDAVLEDHAYVGPNATLCGRSRLKLGAHLGPNAVVLDGKCVGSYAVVGIGAAVTKDVRDYAVVMGNPARRVGVVSRDRGV
jgi:acetyltransferase EpsM